MMLVPPSNAYMHDTVLQQPPAATPGLAAAVSWLCCAGTLFFGPQSTMCTGCNAYICSISSGLWHSMKRSNRCALQHHRSTEKLQASTAASGLVDAGVLLLVQLHHDQHDATPSCSAFHCVLLHVLHACNWQIAVNAVSGPSQPPMRTRGSRLLWTACRQQQRVSAGCALPALQFE
ncbi:hypothetical protein COO60DRAFT_634811 [Scenedesmus sp. NREL 46B-D3]|nr:hypothetical protein COO60DRAFT_634811 [Scenedesmus sp. NREL 46B-D3]